MKHYQSSVIVCPFYNQETALKIYCDGINTHCSTQVSFVEKLHKESHEKQFCKELHKYNSCPIYQAINKQYEENEDESE